MTKLSKDQSGTRDTLLAARQFNRRTLLKRASAGLPLLAVSPMILTYGCSSRARASSTC